MTEDALHMYLESAELDHYYPQFKKIGIGMESLATLTMQDIGSRVGITNKVDRRKLFELIQVVKRHQLSQIDTNVTTPQKTPRRKSGGASYQQNLDEQNALDKCQTLDLKSYYNEEEKENVHEEPLLDWDNALVKTPTRLKSYSPGFQTPQLVNQQQQITSQQSDTTTSLYPNAGFSNYKNGIQTMNQDLQQQQIINKPNVQPKPQVVQNPVNRKISNRINSQLQQPQQQTNWWKDRKICVAVRYSDLIKLITL